MSIVSSSSISNCAGESVVSLVDCPSVRIRSASLTSPVVYNRLSLVYGVCLLILNCNTEPSCPSTFKLICLLFSVSTPSLGFLLSMMSAPESPRPPLYKRGTRSTPTEHTSSTRKGRKMRRQPPFSLLKQIRGGGCIRNDENFCRKTRANGNRNGQ